MGAMLEPTVEAEFTEEELAILDEVLSATATSRRCDRQVALKLQTEAGRSLYRTVLEMRDGPRLVRDWPSGVWDEEMGEKLVREFERSGLTEAAFCRETGISRGRLRGWQRRLRGTAAAGPAK